MTDRETLLHLRAEAIRRIMRDLDLYVDALGGDERSTLVRENLNRARRHVEVALLALLEEDAEAKMEARRVG